MKCPKCQYIGFDTSVHVAKGYTQYANVSGWDTYRSQVQLLALLAGGSAWELHAFTVASLALYAVLLREAKSRREERRGKVAALSARRPAHSFERELEATAD
jgi:hypothetical protein